MAKISSALRSDGMRKLFVSIAKESGISVVFDKACIVPHADSRGRITLPVPTVENADDYWLFAFHELSHLLKEMRWSYKDLPKKLDLKDELTHTVTNIVMDNLCERNFWGQFEGVDEALSEGRARHSVKHMDTMNTFDEKDNPVPALILTLMYQDVQERQKWMGFYMEHLSLPEEGCKHGYIMKSLIDIRFRQRLGEILPSKDPALECEKLVRDILKIIDHESPEMPGSGKGSGEGEGDGDPSGGEGEPEDCEACEGTGEGPDGEPCEECDGTGKKKGEPSDPSGEDREASFEEYGDERIHDGEGRPAKWKEAPADMSADQLKKVIDAIDKDLRKKAVDSKMEKEELSHWGGSSRGYLPWAKHRIISLEETYSEYRPHLRDSIKHALGGSTVSKQIARYLKTLTTESYTYGQRRGKVHGKALHRMINARPNIQPTIYKKKNSTLLKDDISVTILMDCSGSMSGSKYAIGSACCVALSDTLDSLKITHEVLGFTETDTLESYIFKSYHNRLSKEKLMQCMSHRKIKLHNNADGESLMWAAERLMTRPEKRKLMIVLSDGSPAGSFTGNGDRYLKKVCGIIEKESPIELVGIGIRTSAPERYYRDSVVVRNSDVLDKVLFGVLQKSLV